MWWLLTVAVFHALLGARQPEGLIVNGIAASGAGVAIGLIVIGRSGMAHGFSGPLSAGLVVVVSLLSFGLSVHGLDHHVPIASLLSADNPGWGALSVSLVLGVASVAWFTVRGATP